ncbi:extensin family protein [Phreatobacter aquaticus]|nr:extensin family protein [Phreatobacter aquaticus]
MVIAALLSLAPEGAMAQGRRAKPPSFAAPVPEPRPRTELTPPAATPPAIVPAAPAIEPSANGGSDGDVAACHRALNEMGVRFAPAAAPEGQAQCRIDNPVRIEAISLDGRVVRLPDKPLLACSLALSLASFTRDITAPLARGLADDALVAFGTGNGFECRSRNRAAGAKMSAHGMGLAVDIAWFELTSAGRIMVERPATPVGARFIGAVRKAGCGWFTTVLGPGSDPSHANHLHFDRERRGRDGQSRLCQ